MAWHKNPFKGSKLLVRATLNGHIRKNMGSPKGLSLAGSFFMKKSNKKYLLKKIFLGSLISGVLSIAVFSVIVIRFRDISDSITATIFVISPIVVGLLSLLVFTISILVFLFRKFGPRTFIASLSVLFILSLGGMLFLLRNYLIASRSMNATPAASLVPTVTSQETPQSVATKPPLPVLSGADIFNAVNSYRAKNGKPFLSVSDELCKIAEDRANYMMANGMSAFKTSGVGAHTGFRDTQYSGMGIGENLAANVGSTARTMYIWENSLPHRELMLWTEKDGTLITKGCVATRVSIVGSIVVLEVGDK